jgi:F0F1-type ATP synthase membrane subunit b/b'
MGDAMDYYDVHAAIDKAVNEERWSRNRHIEDVARDLRAEFRREVMELREEVGELVAEVLCLLSRETADRTRETDALMAVLAKHDKAKS